MYCMCLCSIVCACVHIHTFHSVICTVYGCPVLHCIVHLHMLPCTYTLSHIHTHTYVQSNIMYVHAFTYHDENNMIISFNVPLVQILVRAMSVTAVLYETLVTMKPVLENFQREIPSPQTVWRQLLTPYCLFSRLKTMRRLLVLLSGY